MEKNNWSLTNMPPENDADVGDFFYKCYEAARTEWERLGQHERLLDNHALYRGKHQSQATKKKAFTPINLFFANVERTSSNITANNPSAEVVDMDGIKDGYEEIMTAKLKEWWKTTGQRSKLKDTADNMEIYGYTPEKPWWDKKNQRPDISVTDPFGAIPAPGVWRDWSVDPPYVCFMYADYVDAIESMYDVEGVASDDTYTLLGEERENHKPGTITSGTRPGSKNATGNYSENMHPTGKGEKDAKLFDKALVIEVWVRGCSQKVKEEKPMITPDGEPILDPATNDPLYEEVEVDKYPDGIRKITLTRKDVTKTKKKDKSISGILVLDDCKNPNINWKAPIEVSRMTYPWGRIPCFKADSYSDSISSYGFSAGEQTADLLIKIGNIFSKLFSYVDECLKPTLIVESYCGISREMIEENRGKSGLVLMPTKPGADIRYLAPPNLPSTFFNVLEIIVKFYDRVYQIEDADRGQAPSGVIAASAIMALQERNAALRQTKIDSIESLVNERGMWAIGLWQNFGTKEEMVSVGDGQKMFQGARFAGRRLSFAVEAGSTVPKTSLQTEEQVKWLGAQKLVDLRTILETLNFPNWKNIVERNGENQIDMALNVLVQAGLTKDEAIQLKQFLMQPQGGPGDTDQGGPNDRPVPDKTISVPAG